MMRDFEDIFLKRAHVRVTQKTKKKKKKKKRKSCVSFGLLFGGRSPSFVVRFSAFLNFVSSSSSADQKSSVCVALRRFLSFSHVLCLLPPSRAEFTPQSVISTKRGVLFSLLLAWRVLRHKVCFPRRERWCFSEREREKRERENTRRSKNRARAID